MRVITEAELREQFKQEPFTSFPLPAGTRLTPSAQQFLSERRIPIIHSEPAVAKEKPVAQYRRFASEGKGEVKPEHMTHINGQNLVPKNHPRIKFRGKLDSLEALVICTIIEVDHCGYRELAKDLGELLDFTRQIMSAEVREQPLAQLTYRGLSDIEIRDHSHNPSNYYGVSHILPNPGQGRLMAQLNFIRTQSRELEVLAMDAFYDHPGEERPDILQALNRLSSLVYIMMLQLASGFYKVGG